jgi:hypothetical protein
MRRKIEKIVSSCWECPYLQYTRGKEVSVLDGWNCNHEVINHRQVIDQRHREEFAEQYPKGFPSWCPLPVLDDVELPTVKTGHPQDYKWVLSNAVRYDLKDCAAYPSANGESWNFFAIRAGTGRTTSESYADYNTLEEIQEMFNRVYGFGAEWKKEPMKSSVKRK